MKRVLLHICCAPDATESIERLREKGYEVTGFFYNPSIFPKEEYIKRKKEVEKLAEIMHFQLIEGEYAYHKWKDMIKGLENEKEGEKRCILCYTERLEKTAKKAKELGFNCFTTTLTISPHKNSEKIFKIGTELEQKYGIKFLKEDFKKQDGFKKSLYYSEKYELYRQDYCGCEFSLKEREEYKRKIRNDFEKVKEKIKKCRKCVTIREHKPVLEGEAFSKIMIVGQAPGVEEHKTQRPFIGPAGKTLWKWFNKIGYSEEFIRKNAYITSVVKCYPGKTKTGDRRPFTYEIKNCLENLKKEFGYVRPELLIPVGSLAISVFLGNTQLKEIIGKSFEIKIWGRKVKTVPLPHPSGLNRWLYFNENIQKLEKALEIISKIIQRIIV